MRKNRIEISKIVESLHLEVQSGRDILNRQVAGGYVSDLLSDVMANSKKDDIWVTAQVHPNIVAVAVLKELAGIIVIGDRKPETETIKKAEAEKTVIMSTGLTAFELAGKLYAMGIPGTR
jgi:hypothetical protein